MAANEWVPRLLWLAGLIALAIGGFRWSEVVGWFVLGTELVVTAALGELGNRYAAAESRRVPGKPPE